MLGGGERQAVEPVCLGDPEHRTIGGSGPSSASGADDADRRSVLERAQPGEWPEKVVGGGVFGQEHIVGDGDQGLGTEPGKCPTDLGCEVVEAGREAECQGLEPGHGEPVARCPAGGQGGGPEMGRPIVRGRPAIGQHQLQGQMGAAATGFGIGEEDGQVVARGKLTHGLRQRPVTRLGGSFRAPLEDQEIGAGGACRGSRDPGRLPMPGHRDSELAAAHLCDGLTRISSNRHSSFNLLPHNPEGMVFFARWAVAPHTARGHIMDMRILVIEDDVAAATYMARGLEESGHNVSVAHDGREGLMLAAAHDFDVLVVDRMLPGLDGLSVIQTLRATGKRTPVLVLSALGNVDDRVKGLNAGGDDYLVKPYAFSELIARLEALTRRGQPGGEPGPATTLRYADLTMDLLGRRVERRGKRIDLQPREFRLLEVLLRHPEQVLTRTMLLEKVWDYRFDPQTNIIDVHISRLRQKIDREFEPALIQTVRGAGYALRVPDQAA